MQKYEEKKFNIPELKGISKKTIEEHLKLYAGYVKNTNSILEKIPDYLQWAEKDPFVTYYTDELRRRFSFEFNGMRNHEYYFEQFEGEHLDLDAGSALYKTIDEQFGGYDKWLEQFKKIAMTRGIGWAVLYFDERGGKLLNGWVDEQHLGQLNGARFILGLDMWEHSFMLDYPPSEKKKYVEAFFENLNWPVVSERFQKTA